MNNNHRLLIRLSMLPFMILLLILNIGAGSCTKIQEVSVPIDLKNAKNVGGLHIELTYNPEVLKVKRVDDSRTWKDNIIESNSDMSGRVIIGLINATGIYGDGPVVTVIFNILSKNEGSVLNLENIQTTDVTTLCSISATSTPGRFTAVKRAIITPVISFDNTKQ